jgi:hypothetical protein
LLKETANSKSSDDLILLDDYQKLCTKFQALFFPNEAVVANAGASQGGGANANKMLNMLF